MSDKKIAFIPWWVATVLSRNNLKAEDLLSFERIQPYFSTEDLTSLAALSYIAPLLSAKGIFEDIESYVNRWAASTASAKHKTLIADIDQLARNKTTQDETLLRLVGGNTSGEPSYSANEELETFEVTLMGDVGVAVWLKPGFHLRDHIVNSIKLIRCAVKKLYVYENYQQLVTRPVGKAYIESINTLQ